MSSQGHTSLPPEGMASTSALQWPALKVYVAAFANL